MKDKLEALLGKTVNLTSHGTAVRLNCQGKLKWSDLDGCYYVLMPGTNEAFFHLEAVDYVENYGPDAVIAQGGVLLNA